MMMMNDGHDVDDPSLWLLLLTVVWTDNDEDVGVDDDFGLNKTCLLGSAFSLILW